MSRLRQFVSSMFSSTSGAGASAPRQWLLLTLAGSALALGVLMWFTSGDVPRADEWDTPGTYLLAHAHGTATFNHLFRQHNESRNVFSQLLAAFIADHWGWNQHIFHALNWGILVVTALLFIRLVGRTWPADAPASRAAVIILCVAVAVVFSPAQWRNFLSSGQIVTITIPCLLALGLSVNLATHLPAWLRYACAAVCALLASFSYVNGLMLWFLLWPAPLVLLRHGRARGRSTELWASIVYAVAALATIAAFFNDYHSIPGLPRFSSGLRIPHRAVVFALGLLAGPIFPEQTNIWLGERRPLPFLLCGGLAGIAGLLAAVYLVRHWRTLLGREFLERAYPFVIMVLYSTGSAASVGIARARLGLLGNVSRYTTIAVPGLLGLAAIMAMLDRGDRGDQARKLLRPLALVLTLALGAAAWVGGIECLLDRSASRQASLSLALRRVCPSDPLLLNVFPRRQYVVETADSMEQASILAPLPALAWATQAAAPSRGDLTYSLAAGEVIGLQSISGTLSPASALEPDDILLLCDRESGRPSTGFLAPAGLNYPGKADGAFEIRFEGTCQASLALTKQELRLARPRAHEVWRLAPR